jgi:transposase
VADRFVVGSATVKRLMALVRETGSVAPRPHGGGNPARIREEELKIVAELVADAPDATVAELAASYTGRTGVHVGRSVMSRALARLGLTRKKKTVRASEQDRDDVKLRREGFLAEIQEMKAEHLVFVDEAGSNLSMTRDYARALAGQRSVGSAPANTGVNVTMIGALGAAGLIATLTISGAADGDVFLAYVQQCLAPQLKPGQTVLMDNVRTHKVKGVKEAIESAGCKLKYLPPYSPEFNPIEECWSKVKNLLKKAGARTREALEDAIAYAIRQVRPQDCKGWFTHSGYRYQLN